MKLVFRYKSSYLLVLTLVMLVMAALPVQAADNVGKQVEVRVKVGSSQMSANGEKIKIPSPYHSGKVAMVPISVFSDAKGFGATLKPSGKSLKLIYLKHSLTLTKGSKTATIDGKKATLPVAPVDKSGITMVPLEAIAKALGIKTSTDAKTKELVIKGIKASSADIGQNRIGDSYYQWSMILPANLVKTKQWDNGSKITFADAKGELSLTVFVDYAEEPLSEEEAHRKLDVEHVYASGKTYVDEGSIKRGTDRFQRIVAQDDNGFFYEYRAIQRNGYFYTVMLVKKAKAKSELDAYKSLLDSFQTAFNTADKSLKDLTIVKDGKIAYSKPEYGLKMQLPVEWYEDDYESFPAFDGPNEARLTVEVFSIKPGDTVDAWVQRVIKPFEDRMSSDYWKLVETTEVDWNGVPAKLVKMASSKDGDTWLETVQLFAMNNNYKYYVQLEYEQADQLQMTDVRSEILNGMSVDFSVIDKSFGDKPDPSDTLDLDEKATLTSEKYGYSIIVPKHWETMPNLESPSVYIFSNVNFYIWMQAVKGDSLEGKPEMLINNINEAGMLELVSQTSVIIAGTDAVKFQFKSTGKSPWKESVTSYLLVKNGYAYLISGSIGAAYDTPLNRKLLEDAFQSFRLHP